MMRIFVQSPVKDIIQHGNFGTFAPVALAAAADLPAAF
jgi:hypothetical protein